MARCSQVLALAGASILSACVHHAPASGVEGAAVGTYREDYRSGDYHHEFLRVSKSLEIAADGHYTFDYEVAEYGQITAQQRYQKRWKPIPGGVRLLGGIPASGRYFVFAASDRIFLRPYRWVRDWCGNLDATSFDGIPSRKALPGDASVPNIATVCSSL